MTAFRGLTWDHPRGRLALETAAREFSATGPDTLSWDAHPLEGFESTPITELAERYDLIVLDHPHLGDALAADCLTPLDELFPAEALAGWAEAAVGPSFASYVVDARPWALPLDAATQVSARRPGTVPTAPGTWDEVRELARTARVAPSLAGPHAFLSLCSIAVSAGADPARDADFLPAAEWDAALALLVELAERAPAEAAVLNPIGLLEAMSAGRIDYVPLVYGYVPYARRTGGARVAFGAPPTIDGRIGSTLGGTGIAVTRRSTPTPALLGHIAWLLSDTAQRGFIPAHEGQPSARSAWQDGEVDAASGGFYSGTLATIEAAWVRPRFAGYIPVQTAASAVIRDAVAGRIAPEPARERVAELFDAARARTEGQR